MIRKNKCEIPLQMLETKDCSVDDSRFCFDKEKTTVIYFKKEQKCYAFKYTPCRKYLDV